jgi:hypothetical protein
MIATLVILGLIGCAMLLECGHQSYVPPASVISR